MNLEQQCVALDLAKRLKELGIKQESLFYWHNLDSIPSIICNHWHPEISGDFFISAFNASELLDLLPIHITTKEPEPFNSYRLYISGSFIFKGPASTDFNRIHIVNYKDETICIESKETILAAALGKYLTKNIWDENPANAFAKMIVFLYEQGLITND